MLTIKVNRTGFTEKQAKKHDEACELVTKIVNSVQFKEKLSKMTFTGLPQGKTGLDVYLDMMLGKEDLNNEEDHEIDVDVQYYYRNNRVVGYTYPSSPKTYVNGKFFDQYTVPEIACNLVHEWLHKLGYDHESASDSKSVPYAVGYMVESMGVSFLSGKLKLDSIGTYTDQNHVIIEPRIVTQKDYVCRRTWWDPRTWFNPVCNYVETE